MRIRAATALDAEEGAFLLRRSITDLCEMDHGGDPSAIEAWTANKTSASWITWLETQPFFYIVEDRNLLAGVCLLSATGEILLNYVHPDFRFRGVSKMMENPRSPGKPFFGPIPSFSSCGKVGVFSATWPEFSSSGMLRSQDPKNAWKSQKDGWGPRSSTSNSL